MPSPRIVPLCLVLLAAAAPWQPKKPNVILIMADDAGVEVFGCYGGTSYETPNLDRLAQRGMRFTNCHSMPLCTPSRVQLMTGLSNSRNYVAFGILKPGQRTFAHYLKDAGYATCVVGKWQLYGAEHYPERLRGTGTLPEAAGFDTHCLWQVEKLGSRYWGPTVRVDGKTIVHDRAVYGPDLYSEHLLRFVEKNKDRPFLAYFPMALVHNPFVPTPDSDDKNAKKGKQHFGAMVAYMDKLVGRVVAKVEELGIADRTLLLFVGDNGTHRNIRSRQNGRKVRGGKGRTTDAGTHVPLLAFWPGTVRAGSLRDEAIGFGDFLPTFFELAGLRPEEEFDGQSFAGALRGEPPKGRAPLTFHYHPRPVRRKQSKPVRFVRGRRYKLYADGRMFDCSKDRNETAPLRSESSDRGVAAARRRLQEALDAMR